VFAPSVVLAELPAVVAQRMMMVFWRRPRRIQFVEEFADLRRP